jgi:hypothetical protein
MRRRGVLVGAWALATITATLVAWVAVRSVTDQVSPAPVLPLPTNVALADGASEAPQQPARRRGQLRQTQQPRAGAQSPPTSADPPQQQPAADEPDQGEPALTESYNLTGGTVTVRYRGGATSLVEATPNTGYDVDVHDGGPGKVDVRFRSDSHESRLVARWEDGSPDAQREERPR